MTSFHVNEGECNGELVWTTYTLRPQLASQWMSTTALHMTALCNVGSTCQHPVMLSYGLVRVATFLSLSLYIYIYILENLRISWKNFEHRMKS